VRSLRARLRRALGLVVVVGVVGGAFTWLAAVADGERETTSRLVTRLEQVENLAAAQGQIGSEITLLLNVGGFEEVPAGFEAVAESSRQLAESDVRDSLLGALRTTDAEGAAVLDRLVARGVEVDPSALEVLDRLSEREIEGITDRELTIDETPYEDAWAWAQRASSAARTDGELAAARLERLAERGSWWSDPGFVGVMAAVLVTLAATWFVFGRSTTVAVRRARAERAVIERRNQQLTELFAALRRIGGLLDRDEVAAAVLTEAVATTGGEFAAFFVVVGDELVPIAHLGDVAPGTAPVHSGFLGGVVESANAARTVVPHEPVLGIASPVSLVAAPMVANGRVVGAVVVGATREQMLDADDETVLEILAAGAAPALVAAARHTSTAELTLVDELTGLYNKRAFRRDLATTVGDATRDDAPVALAMIDIDHFKTYNDTHGHAAGDQALRRVAAIVRSCVRGQDRVYRFGGEELAVLLPGANLGDAVAVAERIRAGVALDGEPDADRGRVTVSVGVASVVPGSPADAESLVETADGALYDAKREGRNRVCVAAS
jgi:diguanylate cyclase (GGDEF)-like protein